MGDRSPTADTHTVAHRVKEKPGVRFGWLHVPLATVVSVVYGVCVIAVFMGMLPLERSETLIPSMLTFPVISGTVLSYCVGNKKPWRCLSLQSLASVGLGLTAWLISIWRW